METIINWIGNTAATLVFILMVGIALAFFVEWRKLRKKKLCDDTTLSEAYDLFNQEQKEAGDWLLDVLNDPRVNPDVMYNRMHLCRKYMTQLKAISEDGTIAYHRSLKKENHEND